MAIDYVDVIVDLQYGDTGKGKVANHLAKAGFYDYVLRYNGGSNAGHTIYHNNVKMVTHLVPVGVIHGVKSIIGPGCVVNIDKLHQEIEELKAAGITVRGKLFVDKRAHVVTNEHIEQDSTDEKIGTTKQGIGPAYISKYSRNGTRVGDISLEETLPDVIVIDIYDILFKDPAKYTILCEGAQGFYLDIDWGEYPYVTTSHCTVGSVCLNGIPPRYIRHTYGVMKAYETYVGNNENYTDPNNQTFKSIQEVGKEFGATTGRRRQVNWTNMDKVIRAMHVNDITHLIINKIDVLEEVDAFATIYKDELHTFETSTEFKNFVENAISDNDLNDIDIRVIWSRSPNTI